MDREYVKRILLENTINSNPELKNVLTSNMDEIIDRMDRILTTAIESTDWMCKQIAERENYSVMKNSSIK